MSREWLDRRARVAGLQLLPVALRSALFARADEAKEIPGVDAARVAVIPVKRDRVIADGRYLCRAGGIAEHR